MFDISAHGLGHLSISGPVINEFVKIYPHVRTVVRSELKPDKIKSFVSGAFEFCRREREVTLVAPSALQIDINKSIRMFHDLYVEWPERLAYEIGAVRSVNADAVISNINYMSIAAARELKLPNIAICCMNWADMYISYCHSATGAQDIDGHLRSIYAGVDFFLQPRPHMPMSDIDARRSIGPIARIGRNRSDELKSVFARSATVKLALYTLGGLAGDPEPNFPCVDGVQWLVTDAYAGNRTDVSSCNSLDWSFADIIASVDVVVGKDSYGTVVEAACAGVPLIMLPRGNWPEEQCLSEWASQNCCFDLVSFSAGSGADLKQAIEQILLLDRKPAVAATGIHEAVAVIATAAGL